MATGDSERAGATVTLTARQLVTIANALNEVCNGVRDLDDDIEFATRIGARRNEVLQLLAEFHSLTDGPETFPE
jgi:hypothetical protein